MYEAKTKALITCPVILQMICAFVFAYMHKAGFLKMLLKSANILMHNAKVHCILGIYPGKSLLIPISDNDFCQSSPSSNDVNLI